MQAFLLYSVWTEYEINCLRAYLNSLDAFKKWMV